MNISMRNCTHALVLLGAAGLCRAAIGPAQLAQMQRSVEQLVRQQTEGLPGKVSFSLGAIDTRLNLSDCATPEAFIPPGVRLWGDATVGLRCNGSKAWTIYVPVSVQLWTNVVVAAHTLMQGRVIEASDVTLQQADLGKLPLAVVTESRQAVGRIATLSIAAGQPLRQDLLRDPPVIQQGQSVTVRALGPGFVVSAEGRAVSNAAEGQVAQVRTASGRTVSGIARQGAIVDIQ